MMNIVWESRFDTPESNTTDQSPLQGVYTLRVPEESIFMEVCGYVASSWSFTKGFPNKFPKFL